MPFERFTHTNCRASRKPSVSANYKGSISFNKAAQEKFGFDGKEFADLYYDRESKHVGISFPSEQELYSINVRNNNSAATISFTALFNFLGIKLEKTTRFPVVQQGEYICFDISEIWK